MGETVPSCPIHRVALIMHLDMTGKTQRISWRCPVCDGPHTSHSGGPNRGEARAREGVDGAIAVGGEGASAVRDREADSLPSTHSSAGARAMADIRETIDGYAELAENWDSYGASPTTAEAIKAAKRLTVAPRNDGGIEFEWDGSTPDECVLFGVGPDGALSGLYYCSAAGDEHEWEATHSGGDTHP